MILRERWYLGIRRQAQSGMVEEVKEAKRKEALSRSQPSPDPWRNRPGGKIGNGRQDPPSRIPGRGSWGRCSDSGT